MVFALSFTDASPVTVAVTIDMVSTSPLPATSRSTSSISAAMSNVCAEESSSIVRESPCAVGASFTLLTVTSTLAEAVFPSLFDMVYVKLSVPTKSASGVNTRVCAGSDVFSVTVPFPTSTEPDVMSCPFTNVMFNLPSLIASASLFRSALLSVSLSLFSTFIVTAVSSAVSFVSSIAVGSSSTGVTVIVTMPTALPPLLSSNVYVNTSCPLKSAVGVNLIVVELTIETVPFSTPEKPSVLIDRNSVYGMLFRLETISTSVSLSIISISTNVSSSQVPSSALATGLSFTWFIVSCDTTESVKPSRSRTVYVKFITPFQSS